MKKALPAAIALASGMGLVGAATANVTNNPNGLGEVLIYPYYTVNSGNATLISVTNTTDDYKAVKVRFLESLNSQEVLDFNLYLSPYDMWTGEVSATTDGGAKVNTADTSCTVPAILDDADIQAAGGVPFRDLEYKGDGGPTSITRTATGYVELIEMGTVTDTAVQGLIKHVKGVPGGSFAKGCAEVEKLWTPDTGTWSITNDYGMDVNSGGLYGSAVIINVADGASIELDATSIDGFNGVTVLHSEPGSTSPSLVDADSVANVVSNGTDTTFTFAATAGVDAVSAVLQKTSVAANYFTDADYGAATDVVFTFPTKRFYVNQTSTASASPFSVLWATKTDTTGKAIAESASACEPVGVDYWDREEGQESVQAGSPDFSPAPPDPTVVPAALCWESTVWGINGDGMLGSGLNRATLSLADGFNAGWMAVDMEAITSGAVTDIPGNMAYGLPVVGFAAQSVINENAQDGVLANYASSSVLKGTTSTSAAVN